MGEREKGEELKKRGRKNPRREKTLERTREEERIATRSKKTPKVSLLLQNYLYS